MFYLLGCLLDLFQTRPEMLTPALERAQASRRFYTLPGQPSWILGFGIEPDGTKVVYYSDGDYQVIN